MIAGIVQDRAYFEREVAPHLGERVRFLITDDGVVPGAAEVALLFEPLAWSQPDQADPGLAITAHVVSSLGGTLSFRRAHDRGSQYIVELPRVAA